MLLAVYFYGTVEASFDSSRFLPDIRQ